MSAQLTFNSYGKSDVRVVKVLRDGARHTVKDLTVRVMLEGAFEGAYLEGDNSSVLPTDTIKNTVYALARTDEMHSIERFALRLSAHFLDRLDHATRATVSIAERTWERIAVDGSLHDHAFTGTSGARRTTVVDRTRENEHAAATVESGIANLPLLKTTGSGFVGFIQDEFTTLGETTDRLFGTNLTARWRYAGKYENHENDDSPVDFNQAFSAIREQLLTVFSTHDSPSVQQTLYLMGEAALGVCADIDEIHLSMPNEHRLLVDLSPFGLDNPNDVFLPVDEPAGQIEGQIKRD